ncbi:MAG: glucans biosynthesis glucosyltransferase MdoH, partial [Pseudomonadota bacterium]
AMGPLGMGMAFWFGSESNYYGHNAILRMAPFMEHCHLPKVRGLGPLNGEILSHDFVEAAFLRRAGYEVWLLPVNEGSYEEMPPDLPRYLKRDRRWCNGNLQHLAILVKPGLHMVSRLHMLIGVATYVTAPLWLFLIGAACWALFMAPGVVAPGPADPDVPTLVDRLAALTPQLWMLALIALLLLAPRLLGVAAILARAETRRRYGGVAKLLLGIGAEIGFTALLAPILMVSRTAAIGGILAGWSSAWEPQNRVGGGLSWSHGLRCQALALMLGIGLTTFVFSIEPAALIWFSPVLFGLVLAVPIAVVSAREDIGLATVRWGLFQLPEEQQPTDVTALEAAQTNRADRPAASIAA